AEPRHRRGRHDRRLGCRRRRDLEALVAARARRRGARGTTGSAERPKPRHAPAAHRAGAHLPGDAGAELHAPRSLRAGLAARGSLSPSPDGRYRTVREERGFPGGYFLADEDGARLDRGLLVVDVAEMVQRPDAEPRAPVDSIAADGPEGARIL